NPTIPDRQRASSSTMRIVSLPVDTSPRYSDRLCPSTTRVAVKYGRCVERRASRMPRRSVRDSQRASHPRLTSPVWRARIRFSDIESELPDGRTELALATRRHHAAPAVARSLRGGGPGGQAMAIAAIDDQPRLDDIGTSPPTLDACDNRLRLNDIGA